MEGLRRRNVPSPGGDNRDDEQKKEGGGGKSAEIDSTCTYLIFLMAVILVSGAALVLLVPDNPVSILLMSAVDRGCHLVALTTPVYAVVLDAGSTGSRVLGFTFFHSP